MKKKTVVGLLAGACLLASTFPLTANGAGKGQMGGLQNRTQTGDRLQTRDRLQDGSCLNSNATQAGRMNKRGNTYGPGDGTGPIGGGQFGPGTPKYGPGPR